MLFYIIEQIPEKTYIPLDMVKGGIVQSKNIGKDIMAGFKTLVGGGLKGYTEMMNEACAMAT